MNDEQPQPAPAGWYQDPHGSGLRWWDGQAWHAPVPQTPPRVPLPPTPAEERNWAMWCHLGTLIAGGGAVLLSAGVLSLFVFVVPLVFQNTYGNRSAWVRAHAVEELNFQLSVLLYSLFLILASVFIVVVTLGLAVLLLIPVVLGLFVWYVVVMVLATTAASRGEFRRYPLTIRFFS